MKTEKADVQFVDFAKAATKHNILMRDSVEQRVDRLEESEGDIDEQKDYQHAIQINAEYSSRKAIRLAI